MPLLVILSNSFAIRSIFYPNGSIFYPDGSIFYPDGSIFYHQNYTFKQYIMNCII